MLDLVCIFTQNISMSSDKCSQLSTGDYTINFSLAKMAKISMPLK